jgi:hypothetical protein
VKARRSPPKQYRMLRPFPLPFPLFRAFFHLDNSQLLPSSSSSRPMNMNATQMAGGLKRDQRKGVTLHQDLVAESDKAERLYRAAMASPHSSGMGDSDASPIDSEAPLSLVRQMKVSVREAARLDRLGENSRNSESHRKASYSPQEAHSRMGLQIEEDMESDEAQSGGLAVHKYPSFHSLRTLRLSAQDRHDSPSSDAERDESMLERLVSPEEEEWARRGRTRSTRGLAWIDSGDNQAKVKPGVNAGDTTTVASEKRGRNEVSDCRPIVRLHPLSVVSRLTHSLILSSSFALPPGSKRPSSDVQANQYHERSSRPPQSHFINSRSVAP